MGENADERARSRKITENDLCAEAAKPISHPDPVPAAGEPPQPSDKLKSLTKYRPGIGEPMYTDLMEHPYVEAYYKASDVEAAFAASVVAPDLLRYELAVLDDGLTMQPAPDGPWIRYADAPRFAASAGPQEPTQKALRKLVTEMRAFAIYERANARPMSRVLVVADKVSNFADKLALLAASAGEPTPGEVFQRARAEKWLTVAERQGTELADLKDQLAELRAAGEPPSLPPSGWQPIETAPRDGTEILACDTQGRREVTHHECLNGCEVWSWYLDAQPTHWMPLPSSPASAAPTQSGGNHDAD